MSAITERGAMAVIENIDNARRDLARITDPMSKVWADLAILSLGFARARIVQTIPATQHALAAE